MDFVYYQLCPRDSGPLTPTCPTTVRLWEPLPFYLTALCSILHLTREEDQGPVVQSIISLTSSLRGQLVKCFMTL